MVIGGNFSSVDSIVCSSVCSLNTISLQWSNLGSGLAGEVYDFILINVKMSYLLRNDKLLTFILFRGNLLQVAT